MQEQQFEMLNLYKIFAKKRLNYARSTPKNANVIQELKKSENYTRPEHRKATKKIRIRLAHINAEIMQDRGMATLCIIYDWNC